MRDIGRCCRLSLDHWSGEAADVREVYGSRRWEVDQVGKTAQLSVIDALDQIGICEPGSLCCDLGWARRWALLPQGAMHWVSRVCRQFFLIWMSRSRLPRMNLHLIRRAVPCGSVLDPPFFNTLPTIVHEHLERIFERAIVIAF